MKRLREDFTMTWALMRRGVNEILRVPGAAIPGILAPTIFMCGLTAVFGSLTLLPGFTTDDYMTFILPVGFLQGAGFTGAATGVNLARDIELGWFDRLLAAPAPRGVLLAGTVLSASFRALMPVTLLLIVGTLLGADFPGLDGLLIAVVIAAGFAAVAASYSVTLALKFRTQAAAPLMQAGVFMAVLFTTSYAPQELLTGWLEVVAKYNPVTQILEAVRQGFVGDVTWADTWPGLVCLAGLAVLVVTLAMRGLQRTSE
jgi:ABC-2 type transport system permease protein